MSVTGAEVAIYRDGQLLGLTENLSIEPVINLVDRKEHGRLESAEIITTDYEVTFSFELTRRVGNGIVALGLVPGMQDPSKAINFPAQLIEVREMTGNGRVLHRLTGAKVSGYPIDYNHGDYAKYRVSGRAIKATEEGEI